MISVDYPSLAQLSFFLGENIQNVGYHVGAFVNELLHLYSSTNLTIESFHVVGFSLGTQVAGHAGYYLGGNLPRITALDPPGKVYFIGIELY